MKRKLLALTMSLTLALSMTACGSSSSSSSSSAAAETSQEVQVEAAVETTAEAAAETAAETEAQDEETEEFTLLDVDSSMIETGLYATGENGEELVVSVFTIPSGDMMVSMFVFEEDGTGDVFCGDFTEDTVTTVTDENGIDWTQVDTTDVYSGENIVITFAELDGEAYVVDLAGNVYTAEYLTEDDTINYMAAAVVLLDEQ